MNTKKALTFPKFISWQVWQSLSSRYAKNLRQIFSSPRRLSNPMARCIRFMLTEATQEFLIVRSQGDFWSRSNTFPNDFSGLDILLKESCSLSDFRPDSVGYQAVFVFQAKTIHNFICKGSTIQYHPLGTVDLYDWPHSFVVVVSYAELTKPQMPAIIQHFCA